MAELRDRESFMVYVINLFADKFKNHAILKGGMELRLLNCPRHTNDVDYTFIPYGSKKTILPMLEKELRDLPGISMTLSVNSKCIVCRLTRLGVQLQVEINVSEKCKSTELSTMELAREYQQQGRIIRAMSLDTALAFKIAAWNERRLMRDLYDIYFLGTLAGIQPDKEVLSERLIEVNPAKGINGKKRKMSLEDLAVEIESQISVLDQDMLAKELSDYLPPEELAGLVHKIKIRLGKIAEFLRS